MDAAQALSELLELSSQIHAAVVLDASGAVLASSSDDPAATSALAGSTLELVSAAGRLGPEERGVTRVEVELAEGAFFAVCEGQRTIGAVTGPAPTAGLVVYDLRTCVKAIADEPAKKKRAPRKRKEPEE